MQMTDQINYRILHDFLKLNNINTDVIIGVDIFWFQTFLF